MGKVIQFPVKPADGLDSLTWRGDSLRELEIFDGETLFYMANQSYMERICIVEITAISERRVRRVMDWGNDLVELYPAANILERVIFHVSEIRIVGVVIGWF